ncbi:P2X purinoceptor 4-like isoform X2 [Amphiura filiformis]|uniref:P2X purinoceptor 4-like isoform X2 n=1 Tax=Amphiura filiformis TaxID=82378 RepID=UPI003B22065F
MPTGRTTMGSRIGSLIGIASDTFFDYDTPKMVQIKSKKVGLINRVIQIGIIVYVVGYVLILERGYQERCVVQGSVTTKLKGVAYTNITEALDLRSSIDPEPYNRAWDLADYVIPPQQTNAFFVMTNMVITPAQTRSTCAEDPWIRTPNVRCESDDDCPKNIAVIAGNGVRTGRCVDQPYWPKPSGYRLNKTCEIYAWCPPEVDQLPRKKVAVLHEAENFTVLIKNGISFPLFNFFKRNILPTSDTTYLRGCNYHPSEDPLCPIFRLGEIAKGANVEFSDIAYKGGVITIDIQWNCNLDHDERYCLPKYRFFRADDGEAKIAKGMNFRFAKKFFLNGTEYRTLTKAHGILFQVKMTGEAGKFNVIPLILNVATGCALLSVATVMCDIVVLYLLKRRQYYKDCKYQSVVPTTTEQEGYEIPAIRTYSKADGNNAIFPIRRTSLETNAVTTDPIKSRNNLNS